MKELFWWLDFLLLKKNLIYSSRADTPKREMEATLPVLGRHSTMSVGHLLMPPVWTFAVSNEYFSLYSLQSN